MFTTTTTALKAALVAFTTGTKGEEAIIRTKSSLDIIPCIMLTASATGAPQLTACDLDMNVQTDLPGQASRGFRVAVDARALKAAVSKFKCAELVLEDIGGAVTIRSAEGTGATVKLRAHAKPQDYPTVAYASETAARFTLPAGQLCADMVRVMEAVSKEETRYYLRGVFAHVYRESAHGPASLRFVSTDGHRLVAITRELPEGADKLPDIILPAKAAAFLTRALKKADGDVSLRLSPSKAEIEANGWRVVTKLIDGTFPDYQRVIPRHNQHKVFGDAGALVADIDALTAHQASHHRSFTLSAGDGWATGWAMCVDNGSAGALLSSLSGTTSKKTTFASFNAKYLAGVIGLIDGEVEITLEDAGTPTLIESRTSPEFLAVIMPIRYSDNAHTPADIDKMNMSPVERFEDEGPALCTATLEHYRKRLGVLVTAAIDSITVGGDRRTARTAILSRLEDMKGERGRATIEAEGQPQGEFAGCFAAWSKAQKGLASRYAANMRKRVSETVTPTPAPADTSREEALERRVRRLEAVLAGRKRQLATVGQALTQSQARNSTLRRRLAAAGSSALAAAARETHALDSAA